MIIFSEPRGWWLFLLWLLFLLVLTRKLKPKKTVISTFFLLRPLVKKLDILGRRFSLIRRLAFLFFISAAFLVAAAGLQPYFSSGRQPLTELVILDLSPSLGVLEEGGLRMETLRGVIAGYSEKLDGDDKVHLIAAAGRARIIPVAEARGLNEKFLKALEHEDTPADTAGAANLAETALQREQFDHFIVFTDYRERWRDVFRGERFGSLPPCFITFGGSYSNAGIIEFDIRRDFFREGYHDIYVKVRYTRPDGLAIPESFNLNIMNNGELKEEASFICNPGEDKEFVLGGLNLQPGRLEVRLQPGGGYPADDIVYAGIGDEGRISVYAVTEGNRFLEEALSANQSINYRKIKPGDAIPRDPKGVYVFDGSVPQGPLPDRTLFIRPDSPLKGLRYRTVMDSGNLFELDSSDPVMRGVDLEDLSLQGFLLYEESPEFRHPATVDGYPLILLSDESDKRWAVLTFDPSDTNVVYDPSYPVLMANIIQWLAFLNDTERSYLQVGSVLSLPEAAGGGYVISPSGIPVSHRSSLGGKNFLSVSRSGIYSVFSKEDVSLGEFYVNVLDPAVSAGVAGWKSQSEESLFPSGISAGPLKIEFMPYMVTLALLLLAAEAFLLGSPRISGEEKR